METTDLNTAPTIEGSPQKNRFSGKRTKIALVAFALVILLSGWFVNSRVVPPKTPPRLIVECNGIELPSIVVLNRWNNIYYACPSVFSSIMSETSVEELPYIEYGERIKVRVDGRVPIDISINKWFLKEDGSILHGPSGTGEYNSLYMFANPRTYSLNPYSTRTTSEVTESEFGAIVGYSITCTWGNNTCEYGFIVLADPEPMLIPHIPGEPDKSYQTY